MVKEAKNIDFYTSGRQPSQEDFSRISEWIRKKKEIAAVSKRRLNKQKRSTRLLTKQ